MGIFMRVTFLVIHWCDLALVLKAMSPEDHGSRLSRTQGAQDHPRPIQPARAMQPVRPMQPARQMEPSLGDSCTCHASASPFSAVQRGDVASSHIDQASTRERPSSSAAHAAPASNGPPPAYDGPPPPPPYYLVVPQVPAKAIRIFTRFRHELSRQLGGNARQQIPVADQIKADSDILAALFLKKRILKDNEEEVFRDFEQRLVIRIPDYTPRYSPTGIRAAFVAFAIATRPSWSTQEGLAEFLQSIEALPTGAARQIASLAEQLSDPAVHKMSSENPNVLCDVIVDAGNRLNDQTRSLGPYGLQLELNAIRSLNLELGHQSHAIFVQLFQRAWRDKRESLLTRSLLGWNADIQARALELREVWYSPEIIEDFAVRLRYRSASAVSIMEASAVLLILLDPLELIFSSQFALDEWVWVREKFDDRVWGTAVNLLASLRYIHGT